MGSSGLAYLSGDTLVVLPALMALYDSRLLSKYIYLFFPFRYPDFVQITLGSNIFQIGLLRYYLSMDEFSVQRVKRKYYAFLYISFVCQNLAQDSLRHSLSQHTQPPASLQK